ncbi:hypothetical protein [Actinoplanes auranticolor]|uniref:Uncharacterized protein n=1 Tax=Actinoplanes auranticolor TaxID=47988 RepID=A0A919STC4_9ACTN|nr:hypothetical protein [Actinoplanes auranticolor]GIM77564.1 hypothetical protein Aau02nite_76470 [Actinoplanes auranticolor]
MTESDIPYENTAGSAWAAKALDYVRRKRLRVAVLDSDGVVSAQVWGTCPRCSHDLDCQLTLTIPVLDVRDGRGLWPNLGFPAPKVGTSEIPPSVEVACGCGRTHPDAPEKVLGCGVSFRLPTATDAETGGGDA